MIGNYTLTARTVSACENFLKIKWENEEYKPIDEFIKAHPNATRNELDSCKILYRGCEKTYKDFLNDYVSFSEDLKLLNINSFTTIVNPTIKASWYFIGKAADCLQNARFFAIKSKLLLASKESIPWNYGYIAHFSFRCIYFGTASTWYLNTFDQLLQAVYWAFGLYTAAKDRRRKPYNETWAVEKIMACCTYKFVDGELNNRGLAEVRKLLTVCSREMEEVRTWANYIKHKGGIEYKYLKPNDPVKMYFVPANEKNDVMDLPDERFAIENFKSPIEVDIDEKITVFENAHKALYECITQIITKIDFEKYQLSSGGQTNG